MQLHVVNRRVAKVIAVTRDTEMLTELAQAADVARIEQVRAPDGERHTVRHERPSRCTGFERRPPDAPVHEEVLRHELEPVDPPIGLENRLVDRTS